MQGLDEVVAGVHGSLADLADPVRAAAMRAYMRDRFPFLGVGAPERRRATADVLRAARSWDRGQVVGFVDGCWARPERELQYVGTDVLARGVGALGPSDLGHLRRWITARSWWDTVDAIASPSLGALVQRFPELGEEMDAWVVADEMWLTRASILHQLGFGADTDAERLFRAARRRAGDRDVFVRKAIGWALRQYARTDPDAVRAFVARHDDELSGLTKREALKHLGP